MGTSVGDCLNVGRPSLKPQAPLPDLGVLDCVRQDSVHLSLSALDYEWMQVAAAHTRLAFFAAMDSDLEL